MQFKRMMNLSYLLLPLGLLLFIIYLNLLLSRQIPLPVALQPFAMAIGLSLLGIPYTIGYTIMDMMFENEYRRIARMFGGSYNAPDKELSVDRFVIKRRSDEFSIIFPSKSRVNLLVNIPFISWKIQLRTKDIKKGPTVDEVRERLTEMKARGYNIRLLQRVNGDFKAVVEFGPYDGEGLIECAREIAAFVEKGK